MIKLEHLTESDVPESWYTHFDHPVLGEERRKHASDDVRHFYEQGYLILERFLPDDLIDAYVDYMVRNKVPVTGFPTPTPFTTVGPLRDLCCYRPLWERLVELMYGDEVACNLALTGWVSTRRDLHQSAYLNPSGVGSHYLAAWMALEDINPASGPFEYLPGSHKLPFMTQAKVLSFLRSEERGNPTWPRLAERITTPAIKAWIEETGNWFFLKRFMARKGDVLIWHSRLLNRDSVPIVTSLVRRALIVHYSVINCRYDMAGKARQHGDQGFYFDL
jgi:hypothetical protein